MTFCLLFIPKDVIFAAPAAPASAASVSAQDTGHAPMSAPGSDQAPISTTDSGQAPVMDAPDDDRAVTAAPEGCRVPVSAQDTGHAPMSAPGSDRAPVARTPFRGPVLITTAGSSGSSRHDSSSALVRSLLLGICLLYTSKTMLATSNVFFQHHISYALLSVCIRVIHF